MKKEKKKVHTLYVTLSVSFLIILIVVVLSVLIYFRAMQSNIIEDKDQVKEFISQEIIENHAEGEIIKNIRSAVGYSLIVGIALISLVAGHIINPIRKLTEATKKVASGDFSADVKIKRNDEIGELADNFNVMVKELNSIEYLRKDFVSNISHELKTPIASIQGFTKLLAQDNLSKEEKQEYINIILEETGRLSNLSSNMIKLSEFEHKEIITNKKKYRIDEQIRKAIIMLEQEINKKNIKITLKSEEITIIEDEDLIMEVWINLLNNAVKYTNENGKIEINVSDEEEFVRVEIKDTGIGIPKEKQDRVFEKFYQAERAHSNEGSGLGLAIVKRIIDLTEGKITLESEVGKGTTFIVHISKLKDERKENKC